MTNRKQIIGLVFGGESSEHEVSIKSAKLFTPPYLILAILNVLL